jgi:hypothetical protein
VLYWFAFHSGTVAEFRKFGIFAALGLLAAVPELRMPMIRLFYKCSGAEGLDELFRSGNIPKTVIAASAAEDRLLALILLGRLSADRECARTITAAAKFTQENVRSMFAQATQRQSPENGLILRMLRNVAEPQPGLAEGAG